MYNYDFVSNYYKRDICVQEEWNVGIYARLSKEDEMNGTIDESESIKNQVNFLKKFVISNKWNLFDIYIDDGYTGLNFDRPDFKRIIEDVKQKKVNLIVSKNLSRLGRDYIGIGSLLEKFFPENKIRYIAVTDNIDTWEKNNSANDFSSFKSVINDFYSKNTSKDIKNSLDDKRKDGLFIGSFAPYGYIKDPKNKNKLIVDDYAASVVVKIFNLYLKGEGYNSIAYILNKEGILNPTAYKQKILELNIRGQNKTNLWDGTTVKTILCNLSYTGCMTQRKFEKASYKSKKLLSVSPENWIIVPNKHKAIISKEKFKSVQELINKKRRSSNVHGERTEKIFSGLVFCGDCGNYMTYVKSNPNYTQLICSGYKRYSKSFCTRHSIKEEVLLDIVTSQIREYIKDINFEALKIDANNIKKIQEKRVNVIEKEIKNIQNRKNKINDILKNLYEDKVKGILSEEEFIELKDNFSSERAQLDNQLINLQAKANQKVNKNEIEQNEEIEKIIQKVLEFNEIDRLTLTKLIDRIEIFENKKVRIKFKFKEPEKVIL